MHFLLINTLSHAPRPYLTDSELEILLAGTSDSRYGKVKRLIAQGFLLHLRRGIYCLTEKAGYLAKLNPLELAQPIYGPSYISLESALSFHQLIPETVYTVTSATSKRTKEFTTPLGIFSYLHLPLENFYAEVSLIQENNSQFFMAKPWKAICDYVYCYKKNWLGLKPLIKSLRIEADKLPPLRYEEHQILDAYYQHARVSRFLKSVQKELTDLSIIKGISR